MDTPAINTKSVNYNLMVLMAYSMYAYYSIPYSPKLPGQKNVFIAIYRKVNEFIQFSMGKTTKCPCPGNLGE